MNRICYIIGAGEVEDIYIDRSQEYFVIAADGGYAYLEKNGIAADLLVGDFDSLGRIPEHEHIVLHRPEKDDTDLLLAVIEGLERGYRTFVIYGALGGRLDHTYGNLQILTYIAQHGGIGYLIDRGYTTEECALIGRENSGNTTVTVIKNTTLSFSAEYKGVISVFCAGDCASGVYLKGLKYELTDARLIHSIPLGVSNEFMGAPSSIEVKDGCLIIMWCHRAQETVKHLPMAIPYKT